MSNQASPTIDVQVSWFRSPWVWFVICVPFSAVLFGVVMIVSANYAPDDLVVDNYYKEGKSINRRLQLDEQAILRGAQAQLLDVTEDTARFEILGASDSVVLNLFHVTDRNRDLQLQLQPLADGVFLASSADLAMHLKQPGIWYLEIRDEGEQWRLRQRVTTPLVELVMVAR